MIKLELELDSYLTTLFEFGKDFQDMKFSILQWRKEHSTQFSIIAIIAKEIIATSASTVTVEQVFSARGSILIKLVRVMSPESVEVQACLDNWIKAALRQ